MRKNDILSLIRLILTPILVMLLGLLLFVNPDSASILIAKILSWGLTAVAIGCGIAALVSGRGRVGKLLLAVGLFATGAFLGRNPLLVASFTGRVIGILLLIDGLQDIFAARAQGMTFLMPLIVAAIGGVLILMPMTASRLVFSLLGLIVLILGGMMLLSRIRTRRLSGGSDDPNIIDAL